MILSLRKFILFLTAAAVFFSQSLVYAKTSQDLKAFIDSHPMTIKSRSQRFDNLKLALEKSEERYAAFYEGPKDDGSDNISLDNHKKQVDARQAKAQKFIKELLNEPIQEVNLFTLEMLQQYLKHPETRPAIKDLIEAFDALEFNDSRLYQQERDANDTYNFATAFGITAALAVAACSFRPSKCSEVSRRVLRTERAKLKLRTPYQSTKAVKKSPDIFADIDRRFGLIHGLSAAEKESAAVLSSKNSFFRRYLKFSVAEKMQNFALVAGIGSIGGASYTIYQKIQRARKEGQPDYVFLNPAELELQYFGALAVLELTCKARVHLNNPNVTAQNLQNFTLRAHEELLLLGRMAGGIEVFNRTPLEFVKPLPESDQFTATIPVNGQPDMKIIRNCPSIKNMGSPIYSSLSELTDLIKQLIAKEESLQ